MIWKQNVISHSALIAALTFLSVFAVSCGDSRLLSQIFRNTAGISSGDILVLSGGAVLRTATPFPHHQIAVFYSDGTFKSILRRTTSTEMLMGMALAPSRTELLYTVDTTDRIEKIRLDDPTVYGNYILDTARLSGTTLRAIASLSDGGTVIAESTTVIEKYDHSSLPERVSVGYPITVAANIQKLRKISGDRFVVVTTGGTPDSPRIYHNDGTLVGTIPLGLSCGTNCDPSDILELPDGRFLVSVLSTTQHSIEMYDSSFNHIQRFYRDPLVLQSIAALSLSSDGNVLACSTSFNTCEKLQIVGNSGVRIGSAAFIDMASVIRQPVDVLVVP